MNSTLRLSPLMLLLACSVGAEMAPETASSFERGRDDRDDRDDDGGNGTSDRLAALEQQNAALQAQLASATAQIEALRLETAAVDARARGAASQADTALAGVAAVKADVYLTTDSGEALSRIAALEGSLLETDPATGEVLSALQQDGAPVSYQTHYNKIKWTWTRNNPEGPGPTPGEAIADVGDAVERVAGEVFLTADDGTSVSRVEALEGALLETDPVTGEVLSVLEADNGQLSFRPHYNKIKWTWTPNNRDRLGSTPGEAIAELGDAVDRVQGDLYLTTGDGSSVSRVEALEGTLLETDPTTGEVISDLQTARGVDTSFLHYNKIKWTYAVHGKTVPQILFGGVPEGASSENSSYSRIEALENTLLAFDAATGELQSRLAVTGFNKIKWTYTPMSRMEDALFPTDPATGLTTDTLVALGQEQAKLGVDISRLSSTDAAFDRRVVGLEDGARTTAATLTSLRREGDVTRQELANLGYVDAGLRSALDDLTAEVCELADTTQTVLRGRWDGEYDEGRQPGFWTGLVIDTPAGELSWDEWVTTHFRDTCPVAG